MENEAYRRADKDQVGVVDRGIWTFYEWAAIIAPIVLMLTHWYGVYDFASNPREILIDMRENESCVAWLYCVVYLYMPLMLIPVTYFFKWCKIFRIPFIYFFFVNGIRLYYGSFLITNEMVDAHIILIWCIIILYIVEFIALILKLDDTETKGRRK